MVIFIGGSEIISELFILDDLSPFGIKIPADLINSFRKEVCILDSENLARELTEIIEDFDNPLLIGNGGILTYTLMKRFGYNQNPEILDIQRKYIYERSKKMPKINFEISGTIDGRKNCLDDIIASGATINQIGENLKCASLVLSSQARGKYRKKEGTSVKNVDELFYSQKVNCATGFPAIFSTRFLVSKVRDSEEYNTYISKYANLDMLLPALEKINRAPLDLLYAGPIKFIEEYGK
ncbi:phosphoribosyltransferase [Candidatus Pacearchaeota archaeon]|nr:phosphoribosyltransferase [Candidatus Pacearchaeota archaeon]